MEHGKGANPQFPALLGGATSITELTESTGSEVQGVQLSTLTEEGKDQLALFVAQRKVVGVYMAVEECFHDNALKKAFSSIPRPRFCGSSH